MIPEQRLWLHTYVNGFIEGLKIDPSAQRDIDRNFVRDEENAMHCLHGTAVNTAMVYKEFCLLMDLAEHIENMPNNSKEKALFDITLIDIRKIMSGILASGDKDDSFHSETHLKYKDNMFNSIKAALRKSGLLDANNNIILLQE
jgi:hypothetical protein